MMSSGRRPVAPALALCHPAWWVALSLLLLNDHVFKRAGCLAPAVTGKLSDVMGLFMVAPLVASLLRVRTLNGFFLCHAATAAAFVPLKSSASSAAAFVKLAAVFGVSYSVVPDASDLWALLALPTSFVWFGARPISASRVRRGWRAVAVVVGTVVGLVGTVASSYVPSTAIAVTPDSVYVLDDRPELQVLDARTGAWRGKVPLPISQHDVRVIEQGLVFTDDGPVLDAATGKQRFDLGDYHRDDIQFAPGRAYVCYDEKTLAAYELPSGRLAWKRSVRCEAGWSALYLARRVASPPYFQAGSSVVAVKSGSDRVLLLDTATGATHGSIAHGCETDVWPSVHANGIFVGCERRLLAFAADGRETRTLEVDSKAKWWIRDNARSPRSRLWLPADSEPLVIQIEETKDQRALLVALDPERLARLWVATNERLIGRVAGRTLTIRSSSDNPEKTILSARDSYDGMTLWSDERVSSDHAWYSHALSDTILVSRTAAVPGITATDLRTGKIAWQSSLR